MNFEYINPATRLNDEKVARVTIGYASIDSAIYPIRPAISPINNTNTIYRPEVACDLNVHLEFAKKLKVTAIQNANTLAKD